MTMNDMLRLAGDSGQPVTYDGAAFSVKPEGKTASLRIGSLSVAVNVLDVRKVFGRVDMLVQPISGSGQQWVDAERVTIQTGE